MNLFGKEVYSTKDSDVVPSVSAARDDLVPCDHEEADTRITRHVRHCYLSGHQQVMIRTVDTDVLVLAVASCSYVPLIEL